MHRMTSTLDVPRAGIVGDMTEDDNGRGYERDETDQLFRQLVGQLDLVGRQTAGTEIDAAAGGFFRPTANTLQCDRCGGWFGFSPGSAWTCGACIAVGR
ncbi:hypothetical protein [Streptomyces cyaneofuscatus]|uniref:Uncharacterized protein n=1 Tax=Streptomyces cyaneofuscatus TaxID=66883 RepID=A0ABZ1F8P0_9ACTN|nr:hypothetical protein [Streptomyces cyaneofuscatus]WSB12600.1 hypothetical protein OG849_35490 [Streptomyces cyaneofuscatus]WSD51153.1 hypothetical protein OG857_35625 [Streptomyces cyaneofuscatus]WSD51184.1 hypothetical protein OG857_35470 [Streptomyces cyaneofuscatus]